MSGVHDEYRDSFADLDAVLAEATPDDRAFDAALRPRTLEELVGQERVREQLSLVLEAAQQRGRTPDHVLLSGPPGLGKTTIAMIIAHQLGAHLRLTSGPAIQHAGDLAAILSGVDEGDVLFIDEIHRMSRPAEELLYMAMEDFRVDVVVGKGPGATAIPLEIPPFTVVGATTRAGLLPGPLRDRFGFTAQLDYYEAAELQRIVERSARLLDLTISDDGAREIASRSRGTPRIANRLLRRVRDYAQVRGDGTVGHPEARKALSVRSARPSRSSPSRSSSGWASSRGRRAVGSRPQPPGVTSGSPHRPTRHSSRSTTPSRGAPAAGQASVPTRPRGSMGRATVLGCVSKLPPGPEPGPPCGRHPTLTEHLP